jgi:uncharacterized protein (DUF2336 family)
MRLFAQDLTTDTLQHIAARGLSEAGGPKPLLLRVLVDLFVRRPSHSEDEIQHFAEIAHTILPSATRAEIDHAAMRLCTHPAAPGEVLDLLAMRAGEGAVLLFEKCRRLSTAVLHHGAMAGPLALACAIAQRDDLDPTTINLLAARPERDILLALVENEKAPLNAHLLPQLVARAKDEAPIAHRLCQRLPHRAEVLSLFLHAARTDRLLMIGAARQRMDSPKQNDMEQAPIDAADLVTAAQTSAQAFALCLAQKLTLPETLAQALTQDHGGEALIIALRALGADGDEVQQISKLLCDTLTEGQLVWRRALCLCISQPLAQMILQAMMHTHRQTLAGPQNTTDTVQQQQQSLSA